ncbi:putative F-box protein At3g20705 [Corylus avellana]|uniref:putative F-box protein At3g20705 n=1 Tax=Corylus avellana TaxID=13451 RepID=UPI00286B2E35|nr:putative F-box protein At3g20705 [Corylus avellana]
MQTNRVRRNRSTFYLPKDVVRDILLRLPVKPLVRFRLVCKSWSALLKSRDFTTTHLSRSASHGCNHLLLVNTQGVNSHTMALISRKALDVAVPIETPEEACGPMGMVGSCNGLVCLYRDWWVYMFWNPATTENRILPTPLIDNPTFRNKEIMRVSVGFGYHCNDYKMVRIVYCSDCADVEVYSTSRGCWRVINSILPCESKQRTCSVILKGVPYWLGSASGKRFVLSFDMGKEVFRQVLVPSDPDPSYKSLGVFNGSLAIIYHPCPADLVSNFIDFWVMKDDESWSKVVRIGPFSGMGFPLRCWEDGVVIWAQGDYGRLLVYDPITKSIKRVPPMYWAPKICTTSVSSYIESLVSVNGRNTKHL